MNEAYIEIKKVVSDCRDCPHMYMFEERDPWKAMYVETSHCGKTMKTLERVIGEGYPIPDWCPFLIERITR